MFEIVEAPVRRGAYCCLILASIRVTKWQNADSARRCRFRKSQQKRASDLDPKDVWIPKLDVAGGYSPPLSHGLRTRSNHHYEHDVALIPAAQPTHPPAVDLISQPSLSEKSQVLRFYTHRASLFHSASCFSSPDLEGRQLASEDVEAAALAPNSAYRSVRFRNHLHPS